MKIHKLADFTRGWVVGDFKPAVLNSKDFEFMVREYKKGEKDPNHIHKIAHEITVIVSGKCKMFNKIMGPGDIIHLEPNDASDFEALEDTVLAVVKTPSVIGDKYLVEG
jgi:quercetin dioxygenase-like cupin family protein